MPATLPQHVDSFIDAPAKQRLTERFAAIVRDVEIHSFIRFSVAGAGVGPAAPSQKKQLFRNITQAQDSQPQKPKKALSPEAFTRALCREVAQCSPRVHHIEHTQNSREGGSVLTLPDCPGVRETVDLFPTVILRAAGESAPLLRITGAPLGQVAGVLVQGVLLLGANICWLSEASRKALAELAKPRHVRVFASPDCVYCPPQVFNAFRAAVARPDLVRAECVVAEFFPGLVRRYGIDTVPFTQFTEDYSVVGEMPESYFMHQIAEPFKGPSRRLASSTRARKPAWKARASRHFGLVRRRRPVGE